MVLDLLAETLIAINEGQAADPTIISHLAKALDVGAAISVYVDKDTAFELVAAYPSEYETQALIGYLESVDPTSLVHHIMVDHHKGVGHIVLINIPPDDEVAPDGGFARIMAFARPEPYNEDNGVLLERAWRPLSALWPQAARAYAQRRGANSNFNITSREREVLELLARGMLATSIASRLNLSPRTVHKHLGNIYRKLGVHDRLVAVSIARSSGLISAAPNKSSRKPLDS
jgi:DNA-binding CsgD family transcriptional regulator